MNCAARRMRVGIDVGGTFTHAVAVDAASFEIAAQVKVPTTHSDPRGVAAGIIEALLKLLEESGIGTEEVVLIAHSTTQATNALLEGDVAKVGIVGLGSGFGWRRARSQTRIGDIELAPEKYLRTVHTFVRTEAVPEQSVIEAAVSELLRAGAEVIVASGAFSVENPSCEVAVAEYCRGKGVLVTAACEISQLYGLRARTRTAVINASMLPKMLETANMTEAAVRQTGIQAPLMIMRSDGGIMDIAEMRKRPILTMLSGPAAGVAAALMHAHISDGVFLEVGGTSTDISAVRHGKPLVKSATVGGHRLYVRTLDVRTVGVAGGSLVRVSGSRVADVGPRSAHIARVGYSAFQYQIGGTEEAEAFQPQPDDPSDYVKLTTGGDGGFAVTPTCASNLLGLVPEKDSARGNADCARSAFEALARFMHRQDPQAIAAEVLDCAAGKTSRVVHELIEDYELDPELLTLTGGGGGASAIVPWTATKMNLPFAVAENAAVISAIGAALALVRDSIERTVVNPTEADLLNIRRDVEESVMRMGASADSVEIQIEIDAQRNILRACASGTTELRTRELGMAALSAVELEHRVRQSVRGEIVSAEPFGAAGSLHVYRVASRQTRFGGLWKTQRTEFRVIDEEGIIRLQILRGAGMSASKRDVVNGLKLLFEQHTIYGDAGREMPGLHLVCRGRILDYSGLANLDQIQGLLQVELNAVSDTEPAVALLELRA